MKNPLRKEYEQIRKIKDEVNVRECLPPFLHPDREVRIKALKHANT